MTDTLTSFYLADWYVDTGANRLCRGDTEVRLENKVMAVLHYLAQHPGELVTRESLESAVWGRTVVGYDALTRCIARLRKVLEDDSRQPRYIETIPKKGYRLIAPVSADVLPGEVSRVEEGPSQTPAAPRPRLLGQNRLLLLSAGLVLGLLLILLFESGEQLDTTVNRPWAAGRPSMVVLPFDNIGGDSRHDYFSDGISVDITTALSQLSGLFVISPGTATDFRGGPVDSKQVADALGVRYVVEGSVRRDRDRLRVNVHLVDTDSGRYLWSEKYDRELRNVFEVQDDITANIVSALSVQLTQAEKHRTARRYTASIEAYDDFLRGQALYGHNTERENLQARDYYQRALDRDAGFARAYSAMAMTYVAQHRYGWGPASAGNLDQALRLAEQGRALDQTLPQAHWMLAYVQVFRQQYRQARLAAERAIALDPNYANSYVTLAVCQMHFGESQQALQLLRKAMLLNPHYPAAYASVQGQIHFLMGDYGAAVIALRDAIERNINLRTAHVFLVASLSMQGQDEEANWAAEQLRNIAADFTAESVAELLPMQNEQLVMVMEMERHLKLAGF